MILRCFDDTLLVRNVDYVRRVCISLLLQNHEIIVQRHGKSLLRPRALLLEPVAQTHQTGMLLPQRANVGLVPTLPDKVHHALHVMTSPHQPATEEAVRLRHRDTGFRLESAVRLGKGRLVTSQGDAAILEVLGFAEGQSGKVAYILDRNELHALCLRQLHLPCCAEDLWEEAGGKVLHERGGPEDGVAHVGALGLFH